MYLEQLAYYIEVIKCGSISAAAKRLYLSQPALSQSISNLETELGTKLISRSYAGVKPTMFGELIFSQANSILSQLDKALDGWKKGAELNSGIIGTAKVACTPDTSDFLSAVVTDEMQSVFPNVVLCICQTSGMFFQFSVLDENSAAIAIGSSLGGLMHYIEEEAVNLGVNCECFSTEWPSILLNSRNPLAEKEYLVQEDLKQLKAAVFPETPPPPFTSYFNGIICQMASEEALAGFISGNVSAAALLVPSTMKKKFAAKRKSLSIVPLKTDGSIPELDKVCHFLIYKKPELLTPAEQCALKAIKYHLKDF